ncbi:MAG: tetratricopeptide repeat protein [Actinobacteria bacterium]|nr:tetratricopeptide repeat protein [Actinomycetota bacterium]
MTSIAEPVQAPLPSTPRLALAPERLSGAPAFLFAALLVGLIGASGGGYAPTAWGWTAIVTLWLAAIGFMVRRTLTLSRLQVAFLLALVAYTAWVGVSLAWSMSVPSTMRELQLAVSYVGIVAAGMVLVERDSVSHLIGGALAGTAFVGAYGVLTRVFPGRFLSFAQAQAFDYRLARPITYWNGQGIFTALGVILGVGLAARAESRVARGLAAAAVPILACATYFTFSRGAFGALAFGLVVMVLVDARRLQLLALLAVLTPWPAIALVLARDRPGLTTRGATFKLALQQGHSMVAPLVLLAIASALVAFVFGTVEGRVEVPLLVRRGFGLLVVLALLGGGAAVWAKAGSPQQIARRTWSSFNAVTKPTGSNQANRLLQLSNNGRIVLWRTSWRAFKTKPLVGHGAGTSWEILAANPKATSSTTYVHSAYLQTFTELGIVGFGLIVVLLAIPFGGLLLRRREPVAVIAGGAYAAWLAHMAIDWDWELSAVSAVGLLCALVLVCPRSSLQTSGHWPRGRQVVAGSAFATLALLSLAPVVSAGHVAAGQRALNSHLDVARAEARSAESWSPWSSDAWILAGDAETRFGNFAGARAAYRKAITRDPESWLAWRALASVSRGPDRVRALGHMHRLHPGRG